MNFICVTFDVFTAVKIKDCGLLEYDTVQFYSSFS